MAKEFKAVKVSAGRGGWGGPLVIKPTDQRNKIASVTGGGIHPVARRLAELTGGEAIDGFKHPPLESEMAAVVVDCGGTARCGVYPRKRIPTINLNQVGQAGPMAQFITEDIYVSGVTTKDMAMADGSVTPTAAGVSSAANAPAAAAAMAAAVAEDDDGQGGIIGLISSIGRVMGKIVGIFFNAGRRTIDQVVRNVLPFMAFVTMLIGLILYTGIGDCAGPLDGSAGQQHRWPFHPVCDLRPAVPVADPWTGCCDRTGHWRGPHRSADRQWHDLSRNVFARPVCLQYAGGLRLCSGWTGAG